MNYIILNDVNSNTIQGLLIQNLPPITKPQIRTNIEEIDGRDGDIITKLGYSAYEKEFDIGLYGNYDVDQVISYFNSEGTVIFSNEDDKFYKYTIIEQIDFEKLIRFKTAKVKMHVQPFKYSNTDTDIEIYATETDAEGTNLTINNTENGASFLNMQLKGQTTQDGTPTPSAPVNVNVVTGNTNVLISNKNLFNANNYLENAGISNNTIITSNNNNLFYIPVQYGKNYVVSFVDKGVSGNILYGFSNSLPALNGACTYNVLDITQLNNCVFTPVSANNKYLCIRLHVVNTSQYLSMENIQIEVGSTATSYIEHQEQSYTINLGKNLLNNTKSTTTLNGLTFTINEDKSVTITGTATSQTDFYLVGASSTYDNIGLNAGTYNLSGCINGSSSTYMLIAVRKNSSENTVIYPVSTSSDGIAIEVGNDYTFRIFIRITNGTTMNTTIYPQLEKGSTATSYAPYFTPIELCEMAGYQDYIYKNNGNWFIHKEIGKVVLNGSETWTKGSDTSSNYYIIQNAITSVGNYADGLSNYFINAKVYPSGSAGKFAIRDSGTSLMFNSSETSVENWKTWLTSHNISIYYPLATPTETQITDENLIAQLEALRGASTYINQTNIITSGDLAPIIYVNVDTIDTNAIEVVNSGNIYSKPVVTITGLGTINLYLNDYQVFILELGDTETTITLDVENMEAYNINTGQLMNRQVTGDYNNFIFNSGTNIITWSGTIASVQIVNYSRWI